MSWWNKLRPVPRTAKMRQVVTREWVEAVQEALLDLAAGKHLDVGYGLVKGPGNHKVRLDVRDGKRPLAKDTLPPFTVELIQDGEAWAATVTPGVVCERVTTDGNAVVMREPDGIWDGDELAKFTVAAGQSIAVQVAVTQNGAIDAEASVPVSIVVVTTGAESSHYLPWPVGSQAEGSAGMMSYELAKFEADGDVLKKTDIHAGSHIGHWRDLPKFETIGYGANVFKDYDQPSGNYRVRALSGGDNITVEETENEIVVSQTTSSTPFPGGIYGQATWTHTAADASYVWLRLDFADGVCTGMSGTNVTGEGTAESPYEAEFQSSDTDT